MNAYDKSSLFAMSFAFMRRFAFIDIGLPSDGDYPALLERWLSESQLPQAAPSFADMRKLLDELIKGGSALMKRRALGPAIIRDIIQHVGKGHRYDEVMNLCELLCEAFLLHAVPQLDGLEREVIREIYGYLNQLFAPREGLKSVQARLWLLYPHINDWP